MKNLINQNDCNGCGACNNICNANAIHMIPDSLSGFLYPQIDESACLSCGFCLKVCPVYKKNTGVSISKGDMRKKITKSYVAWSKSNNNRFSSTSGGIFSELASAVISRNGIVYGAGFDACVNVVHMGIQTTNEIDRIKKSKYVQSNIGNVYKDIRKDLVSGRMVFFVGTPCQVAGLYSFLGIEYEKLFTAEFICIGVNSPMAYKKWLEELEKNNQSKVNHVWFKYKINGWRHSPFCTRVDFDNNKSIVLTRENNYFMQGFLQGNYFLRPSCSRCKFMGNDRVADIILGDYWGKDTDNSDDMGNSIVLINSDKGRALFESILEQINYNETDLTDVCANNPRFSTPIDYNEQSTLFYQDLKNNAFSEVVKKYIPCDDPLSDVLVKIVFRDD